MRRREHALRFVARRTLPVRFFLTPVLKGEEGLYCCSGQPREEWLVPGDGMYDSTSFSCLDRKSINSANRFFGDHMTQGLGRREQALRS